MKSIAFILSIVFAQSTFANQVRICSEIETSKSTKAQVRITHVKPIPMTPKESKKLDSKSEVLVQLYFVKSGRLVLSTTFKAIETTADVQGWVNSRSEKFSLYYYMDEANQDGFSIADSSGVKTEYRLNCEFE